MTGKSIPSVLVVAGVAFVAIGFGNAIMDLLTVGGAAVIAFYGFQHFQGKISDLKAEKQRADIEVATARRLLKKHGISPETEELYGRTPQAEETKRSILDRARGA